MLFLAVLAFGHQVTALDDPTIDAIASGSMALIKQMVDQADYTKFINELADLKAKFSEEKEILQKINAIETQHTKKTQEANKLYIKLSANQIPLSEYLVLSKMKNDLEKSMDKHYELLRFVQDATEQFIPVLEFYSTSPVSDYFKSKIVEYDIIATKLQALSKLNTKKTEDIVKIYEAIANIILTKNFLIHILEGVNEKKIPTMPDFCIKIEKMTELSNEIGKKIVMIDELNTKKLELNKAYEKEKEIHMAQIEENKKIINKLTTLQMEIAKLGLKKIQLIS